MRFVRRISPTFVALPALVLALSVISFAQEQEKQNSSEIKIKNFGQMDERFYRGARPKDQDLKALAAMGIKTVIDLTDNSREFEQPAAEAAGGCIRPGAWPGWTEFVAFARAETAGAG